MDEDYTIIENELIHQLAYLKRDLHMKKVKTLDRKLQGLKKMALQRKLRRSMTLQVEELEFTVSKIYSPQNAVKDNEIKFYLIYLLQLKDFFQREVQTKKEIIQQREDQYHVQIGSKVK
ncbi:hypothetical protein JTE90_002814 [Oedothorax gibbosus]|uniref:Uncharacterized protein n=1 Tax=Oedothorax gibbosus TaxID=931172 RepID=A0AAV6U5G1_9ARAC|nr:hypothetical protein JTE90_002814 [Oedothorax gibbosus]